MQGATAFLSASYFEQKGVPMSSTSSSRISAKIDRRALIARMAPHQTARLRQALWQLGSTWTANVAVVAAMYASLSVSVWLTLALAIPAAGLTVRIFIIQHDCGHGSFFRSRLPNEIVGSVCGIVTMTPYGMWRRQHSNHHGVWNNLDRRSSGADIYSTCLTLKEYQALSAAGRWFYRSVRHPVVSQILLPPFVFLLLFRIPFDAPRTWKRERMSVHLTNVALLVVVGGLMLLLGVVPVLLVQLPIIVLASIAGVWLFSVQHRFEEADWARQDQWSPVQAALHGSSYLKLPPVLRWFSGNIGFHHVHHLSPRIPNYRLAECHHDLAEICDAATTLTFRQALLAPAYTLWDEEGCRMVMFPAEP
jgi:omega-6 fatty acid desaturase (delta-12 desaturase)